VNVLVEIAVHSVYTHMNSEDTESKTAAMRTPRNIFGKNVSLRYPFFTVGIFRPA